MNSNLRQKLINLAEAQISDQDPSHDILHSMRVLQLAEKIAASEKADLDIVVPAALFHDLVNIPKNHPNANDAPDLSAKEAANLLEQISEYPKEKIPAVKHAISSCSFSKGAKHETLEAKVVQDADGLEATGAISIFRTFCSTGQMKRPFYNQKDPFCETREPNPHNFAVDLFYARLFKVKDRMYTNYAKKIAIRRTEFLKTFLVELKTELELD